MRYYKLKNNNYIYTTYSMQFPQINKYQSLIEKHLKPSYQPIYALSYDIDPFAKQSFDEILQNIQSINLTRSFNFRNQNDQQNTMSSPHTKSNVSSQQTLSCDKDIHTFHSERKVGKRNSGKSLMFNSRSFNKNKNNKLNFQKQIKVYYFNLPNYKMIPYDKFTTIEDLINTSVNTYLQDKQLDQTRIEDRNFKNFQMRLLQNQGSHKADMNIEAISYSRFIEDNMLEALVLLPIKKFDKKTQKFENLQIKSYNKNTCSIILYNEMGEQLGTIEMNKSDSLEKIFDYIQTNDLHQMRNYYLTENINDNDNLPKDFQIKNLQSSKIFIKSKRYIDQSQFQSNNKPIIRRMTHMKDKQKQIPEKRFILPIGANEASRYQEFTVIKVNNMGIQQERIIGIDQTKIYNYDRMVREQKKQTSFLSKIFGVNQNTGTKRPHRFISDIIDFKKIEKGFIITFKQKSIKYFVENDQIKQKISRKLNYLINLANEQRRSQKNKL